MRTLLAFIDRLSRATGLAAACLTLPIGAVMIYEVVLRFAFDLPTFWAYELAYMMTGAYFALGAAYVTLEDGHVRIDFLYARMSARARAMVDGLICLMLVLPVSGWLAWALCVFAAGSAAAGELSGESAWNPPIWPLHIVVAIGFVLFALQIAAQTARNLMRAFGKDA